MQNGAIYILTQNKLYVDLALQSIASLKQKMPELPVTVFSEFPIDSPLIEQVIPVPASTNGLYEKAKLIQQSPYERTLFVDADILILEPFPEIFDLLDRFDCAATHEEYVDTDWFHHYPRPDIPSCFPEFNTGILLFKRSLAMQCVFQEWQSLYTQFLRDKPDAPVNDQTFFRAALYHSDARIATLTREYNCKYRGQGYLNGPVKMLHGHIDHQFDIPQLEQAARALNASQRPRVYIAGLVYEQELTGKLIATRKARKIGTFPLFPGSLTLRRAKRLRQIISKQGLRKTFAKLLPGSAGRPAE